MKPIKGVLALIAAFLLFCFVVGQARGQDTQYRDTTIHLKYPVFTKTDTIVIHKTDTVTVVVHDTVYIKGDSVIVIPPVIPPVVTPYKTQAMYVSPIADWINNPTKFLSWAKREGVNELNLYARSYLQSSSNRDKLAAFIKNAKENYGIKKVSVDYRLTSELPYWKLYNDKYNATSSAIDILLTEREPYVTGDYAGFYPFLREGKAFAKTSGQELICYMGHPTDQAWDSIVYYCDKVYLSLYITMSTWGNSTNGYNYVRGRWEKISASAAKQGKENYPVAYIMSLERKTWGAGNDFMGEWYMNHSFYGSTMETVFSRYEENASGEIKKRTDLVGVVIFYSKYGVLARP